MRQPLQWLGMVALALLPFTGAADAVVALPGQVSDTDFYRAVACGAVPGGDCTHRYLRWPRSRREALTVALRVAMDDYPSDKAQAIQRAVGSALREINAAGAAIHLSLVADETADIQIYLTEARAGEAIRGTRDRRLEGAAFEPGTVGFVVIGFDYYDWNRISGTITSSVIAISQDILPEDIPSIVLEEIVQGLGFPIDVVAPYYETRSIFSQSGNSVTNLRGQDATALQMHYRK